jgi:hypothetical protein
VQAPEGEGVIADNGGRRIHRAGDPRLVNLAKPTLRPYCDLKGCTEASAAVVDLDVSPYTGRPGETLMLAICAGHANQYESGALVAFAWAPVYRHEVEG